MFSKFQKNLFLFCILALLTSCAKDTSLYKDIDVQASKGDFELAVTEHEKKSKKLYNKHDIVLENLNSGMLEHYASQYESSNKKLSLAEELIFNSYGISISDTISSAVVNDTLKTYAGEDYEDIYINAFKALNFIALEQNDSAMVEIRRLNRKLTDLRRKYEAEIIKARKEINNLNLDLSKLDKSKTTPNLEFTESAFARYISMLLYRDERNLDSANIDYKYILDAYRVQKNLYNFTMPSHIEEDINYPKDMARLNVLSFTGFAPTKKAQDLRLTFDELYIKVSLPVLVPRPSAVASIEIRATNKETKKVYIQKLEKLESIENIMLDTFKQKTALIYTKSVARSLSKAMITNQAAKQTGSSLLSPLAQIVLSEITEHADTRIAQYFPASVYSTGLTVEEGMYDIAIIYKNKSGSTLYTSRKANVEVEKGYALNLVESTYLR